MRRYAEYLVIRRTVMHCVNRSSAAFYALSPGRGFPYPRSLRPTVADFAAMNRSRLPWPWWRCVLTGLTALALAMSAYLSWQYLVGGPVIGCGGDGVCDQVLSSRWSAVAGVVPVSGLAAGVYLAILVATYFIGSSTTASDRRLAWSAMQILAGAAIGSAVWFTVVQKWVLGAFCPLCTATHITGLFLAALIIWQAHLHFDHAANFAQSDFARTQYALTAHRWRQMAQRA